MTNSRFDSNRVACLAFCEVLNHPQPAFIRRWNSLNLQHQESLRV